MKEPKKYAIPENSKWIKCKCGKEITFVMNEKGTTIPVTKEGINHFIDCKFRDKFRKKKNDKLKTLKEIELKVDTKSINGEIWIKLDDGFNTIYNTIKQEAIKHIKKLERDRQKIVNLHGDLERGAASLQDTINWVKHFFNIIKEDMK